MEDPKATSESASKKQRVAARRPPHHLPETQARDLILKYTQCDAIADGATDLVRDVMAEKTRVLIAMAAKFAKCKDREVVSVDDVLSALRQRGTKMIVV